MTHLTRCSPASACSTRRRPRPARRPAGPRRPASPISAPASAARTARPWSPRTAPSCAPGLVDMRAALGEPGYEYRETIASAAEAAAAGGITTLAALPDTLPAIDDPALVRLLRARGEETGSLTILPYGAVTTGCRGEELAELGLLREAGAVAFTDGSRAIASVAADAAGAVLRPRLRRPDRAAPRGPVARRRRRRHRGRTGHAARPARHPGRRRGDPGRARHPAGGADRRRGAFRPCLHRRRAGADPPGEGRRSRGDLRHRAAVFRPQRDRDRRLPHLRQAVAAAAQGGRPAGGGRPRWPTARSTRSPPTTSRAMPTTSASRSPRRRRAAPGSPRCSA